MPDEREPKAIPALIYPLPVSPQQLMTPRDDTGMPAPQQYLSGMWKRRDGHNVQNSGPTPQQLNTVQQLDPWARRSPPAVDV